MGDTIPLFSPSTVSGLPVLSEGLQLTFDNLRARAKSYNSVPDNSDSPNSYRIKLSEPSRRYQATIANRARQAMQNEGRLGFVRPVAVLVICYFKPPTAWSASRRREAAAGEIAMVQAPDADNLFKSTADALTGICWVDDSQIIRQTCEKRYSDTNKVVVRIQPVNLKTFQPPTKPKGSKRK